ncbi:hypothetical protein LCGC14_2242710 [marine sediment metagenome]|uniref:Uncharacterized protein n=1 Tax=marine sediment metagenome TaxID=412755 RepID=A0A0F9FZX1_9ZZZZ
MPILDFAPSAPKMFWFDVKYFLRGLLRPLSLGMGTVGTVLITLNACGVDVSPGNVSYLGLAAAIMVGAGVFRNV